MKKKKTLYFMLPLIILVWGFVFYQLYSYFFSSPTYNVSPIKEVVNIDKIKQDTFSIVANYRDPFLGKKFVVTNSSNIVKKTAVSNKKKKVQKAIIPWPKIVYQGMIKNNSSDRKIGIVKINGKERLVKEKEVIQDISFISISKEQIIVSFQKEKKTIVK